MKGIQEKNKLVIPFVKWVGGKRQLLDEISLHLPDKINRYFEPFIGGGAVLFHIQPKNASINDSNKELTNLYETIKSSPEELIEHLKTHKNNSEYFYQIRKLDRNKDSYSKLTAIEKASRLIFLNKTCYNGLFRVNSAGEFNTPFGKYKNPNIVNEQTIKSVSNYLNSNNIKITTGDYEIAVKEAQKGDFVYLDPPYDPVSVSSNFTGYTKTGFNREEQERLKKLCDHLDSKGVNFLLSNSATEFIQNLYSDYTVTLVNAKRFVNSKASGRGDVNEVLVKNYT